MLNSEARILKSEGVDKPRMTVYLAGRIAGNCIEKCIGWRQELVNRYKNYKKVEEKCDQCDGYGFYRKQIAKIDCEKCNATGTYSYYGSYPISFLCPLNSGEDKSVDAKGLSSSLNPNMIYDKDLLSVKHADVIIANMEDYFEEGLEEALNDNSHDIIGLGKNYDSLKNAILNRRENIGTVMEVAWALYLQKPVILIVPEKRKENYIKHPFTKRASAIVTSVDQLIEEKHLNILYKSIASAVY